MTIEFISSKKRKRNILILGVILVIVIVVSLSLLKKGPASKPIIPELVKPSFEINYEILKDSLLEKLQIPVQIPAFEGEAGRENPFLPY